MVPCGLEDLDKLLNFTFYTGRVGGKAESWHILTQCPFCKLTKQL